MKPTLILGALAVWWLLAPKKATRVEIAGTLATTEAPPAKRRSRAEYEELAWRKV